MSFSSHTDDTLTWNRHKELDGISVAMEAQLCLGHGTVGDEAPIVLLRAVVSIHMDHAPRGGGRHFVCYKHTVTASKEIPVNTLLYARLHQSEQTTTDGPRDAEQKNRSALESIHV